MVMNFCFLFLEENEQLIIRMIRFIIFIIRFAAVIEFDLKHLTAVCYDYVWVWANHTLTCAYNTLAELSRVD